MVVLGSFIVDMALNFAELLLRQFTHKAGGALAGYRKNQTHPYCTRSGQVPRNKGNPAGLVWVGHSCPTPLPSISRFGFRSAGDQATKNETNSKMSDAS